MPELTILLLLVMGLVMMMITCTWVEIDIL
jgi:hypothetical protein